MGQVLRPLLCSECSSMDLAKILKPPMNTYRLLATWHTTHILHSRLQCTLCAFLFNVLDLSGHIVQNGILHWRHEFIYVDASAVDGEPGCRVLLTTGAADMMSPITLIRSQPYLKPLGDEYMLPGASTQSFRPISGRAIGETVSWPLVRDWVDHCCSRHAHDTLGEQRNKGETTKQRRWSSCFRLVNVKDKHIVEEDMSVSYAALSYVWGGSEPVKLVRQNMKELMTKGGLDRLACLPQTFQDAMHVAEQLGMTYLWIDALCIQHDDDADRDHQINGMDQIYRGAFITIISVTPNADSAMPGVRVGTRNSTNLKYNEPGVDLMYARPDLAASIAQSDWESRGWTLQEKFFSKRLLYFTKHQVFFECTQASWAEDAVLEPSNFNKKRSRFAEYFGHTAPFSTRNTALAAPEPSIQTILHSFLKYQTLLEQYMKRNLTRDTDILAAFSGILNSFEDTLGASTFGLPEFVFGAVLMWYGDPYARRRTRFPSWSWCGWIPKRSRDISWLVAGGIGDEEKAWGWSTGSDMPRSIEIHDLSVIRDQRRFKFVDTPLTGYYLPIPYDTQSERLSKPEPELPSKTVDGKFIIPLPRPLPLPSSLNTHKTPPSHTIPSLPSLTISGSTYEHILHFECDTFFDEEHIQGDIKLVLEHNLDRDHKRGRPLPHYLDFLVMSGCRENDTWFKRRQGTYALPPAPLLRVKNTSANVNIMLVKTDANGVSERIWVFSIVMENELPDTVRKIVYLA